MKSSGILFIWANGQSGEASIEAKLDRFLASKAWSELYKEVEVQHLLCYDLDHMPIILATSKPRRRERKREQVIRFEQMWLREEACEEIVVQTWGCDIC